MKRIWIAGLTAGLLFLSACGGGEAGAAPQAADPNASAPAAAIHAEIPPPESIEALEVDGVVDLTQLSGTMAFAQVNAIGRAPADYEGVVMKVQGVYYASYNPYSDQQYHYVMVEDSTVCCAQGLEFTWIGEQEFPQENARVEITGVWGGHEEDGGLFYYIDSQEITVL